MSNRFAITKIRWAKSNDVAPPMLVHSVRTYIMDAVDHHDLSRLRCYKKTCMMK